jgi:large subunit ribosomal protein L17
MLANMASSLILHKRIQTTTAKAKALRTYVEPLLTKSKEDSTHSRRIVFSQLQNKDAVTELFREVSPKIAERPGGYTRILKTGTRLGDNADMCVIELVDYNENLLKAKEDTAAKSGRRRRRGGKKKGLETTTQAAGTQGTVEPVTEQSESSTESVTDEVSTPAETPVEEVKNEPTEVKESSEKDVEEDKAEIVEGDKKEDKVADNAGSETETKIKADKKGDVKDIAEDKAKEDQGEEKKAE